MRIKSLLAAFVLMAVPGFAYAECSWGAAYETTMSCAQGTAWDANAQTCVPTATS
ncbi:MAG: carbohydrate-binding module family 14 protein [Roseicyclus sp.]